MRKHILKNHLKKLSVFFLAGALAFEPAAISFGDAALTAGSGLFGLTAYANGWQGLVKATTLNVRSGPGTSYSAVDTLENNTSVTVISQTTGTDGETWYQISYGNGKTGYARYDFIKQPTVYSASDANFEAWMNEQGFPESYKNDLRGLHQQYPNWVFKAQHTGLDWNEVIAEESKVGRNLVYKTSKSSWKSTAQGAFDWANNSWPGFDGAAWQAASSEIISYYMDPRNFLSEPYIFQFELQSYDPSTQTKDGLLKIIEGTFLEGDALVPVEGSQVEGGEIVEVAVSGNGTVSGTASAGNTGVSSGAQGPGAGGTGSSGSGNIISSAGPGGSDANGFVNSGPGAADGASVSAGTSGTSGTIISAGPMAAIDFSGLLAGVREKIVSGLSAVFGGITAYAGTWKQDASGWWYQNDDGSYLTGWHWLDGNNDGTAECYYFYDNGYMAANTEIDGYKVDGDGKWTSHAGEVYTRPASETGAGSSSGSAGAVQTVQMKKVPYADILMKAAEVSNVSPYVLASMIIQEQGVNGTSDLISGTHSAYPGYYNFFNLGAYAHDGMGAVEAGLKYASESGNGDRPWNTVEKAIIGGASAYGANYVNNGQDTFYLKKFNVQGSNKYNHQYMTNVPAAANEGAKVSEAYSQSLKATALEFKIPVYNNMPENPCPMPAVDGNPNNKLRSINVDGYTLTPTFNMDVSSYDLIVEGSAASVNITAETIDGNASVSGTGTVNLNVGLNTIKLTVTAENGDVREYTLNINRRDDGSASQPGATAPAGTVAGPGGTSGGTGTDSTGTPSPSAPAGPDASGGAASDVGIIVIG